MILDPNPDPNGTIVIRFNGTHMGDLENPNHFSPIDVAELRSGKYPLYIRHNRTCGNLRERPFAEPRAVGDILGEPQSVEDLPGGRPDL